MDEIELESPKASPAETLRAYSFLYGESDVLLHAVRFCIYQTLLVVFFLAAPDDARCAFSVGILLACFEARNVYIRNSKRQRLRMSLWEQEMKQFCPKRRTVVFATIVPFVAIAAWLTLIFIGPQPWPSFVK